ncbi:Fic family protein [Flavobacterium psychrotrophum]|uniref:Fic family protein n=1 Tax=Flavobacterium psychrotrophum TaxID=2294119 RepID=UPI000E320D79|nr:Fic family protein [Flavobacterium psychrotrophum]
MAIRNEKLAEALQFLHSLQQEGAVGIYTDEIPNRRYRELLQKHGFIKEVLKGWYIPSNPDEKKGETTSWYTSYWDFIAKFLGHRYGDNWSLSPDHSLLLHAGNNAVPKQLIIRSPQANNNPTQLVHGTSIINLKGNLPDPEHIIVEKGIRIYDLPTALIYCSSSFYTHNPIDARTALSMIRDASEVLPLLLENGHTTYAGRLAAAFRNIERDRIADQVVETFRQADFIIREDDPFEVKLTLNLPPRERSAYANRIRLMWQQMRDVILLRFPAQPGLPKDADAYLNDVDEIYVTDAYHSLSIERYTVTPELIAKVSSGEWDFEKNKEDRQQRDAMAARGYYQAFLSVKESIMAIMQGANPGAQVDMDHSKWYRELFDPSVAVGLLKASDLAGYRRHQVYIGNSQHVPLSVDSMRDAMPVLFELLEQEQEASVRSVLGHFIFVFIHPYMDGNGRMGRFIMNAMLASGGYPWTVIPVERREEYMQALEHASVGQNIEPLTLFIASLVQASMDGKAIANLPAQ